MIQLIPSRISEVEVLVYLSMYVVAQTGTRVIMFMSRTYVW